MEDHSRTIIHLDIDCFYAQVEMVKNPNLSNEPLGIQQKNIVVTSNYIAREYGIKKCMLVSEAKKLCPNLVLVNGEDLHDYRQFSYNVTALLQRYSELVERLGLDENFVDITDYISKKFKKTLDNDVKGYVFGITDILCDCGCTERLTIGSQIAQEIRDLLYQELKLTTCAGIAHNKLLAKIVCSKNKPNKQTIVFSNCANELLLSLGCVRNIPSIGSVSVEQLAKLGINTVEDLQNARIDQLAKVFGTDKAKYMIDVSFGKDTSSVKKSGKPLSIGLEDSCKAITVEKEIEYKLSHLLTRLMILVKEDGRVPRTVKLVVRKFNNAQSQNSVRETRQCNISPSLFSKDLELTELNQTKLMKAIMTLFRKVVDIQKSYHVTLLGLSFTKFLEKPNIKNTLTGFLTQTIEVQSVTDIENQQSSSAISEPSTSLYTEYVDSPEPHPKRGKFFVEDKSRHCTDSSIKLGVATLRLNSIDSSTSLDNGTVPCPPNADEEVFRSLPSELQRELWEDYKKNRDESDKNERPSKKIKSNSILNYVVKKTKD